MVTKNTIVRPSEGEIPFDVPEAGKPCYTWYKVVGDLNGDASKPPLITLHGGPSACHDMLSPFADLNERFDIPVIFYDQIGNGKSTHLREKAGDESFWVEDLFVRELDNLIDYLGLRTGFCLYGQSWGGMLGARYATLQPTGTLKNWTVIKDLPRIQVETFALHGRYDHVQDIAVTPFFELIPRVRWVTMENSSHVGFFEERERYMELVGGFLLAFQASCSWITFHSTL